MTASLPQNQDIGFMREGQPVEVKIDAFPFTRFGLIEGHVRRLGRDAASLTPPSQAVSNRDSSAQASPSSGGGQGDLVYPAKVALARDWIVVDGKRERLQPGMRVSAEIKTGDRRVIEYLLSPVIQAVSEAGRER